MYISNHFHVSPMFICHLFPKQNNTLKGLFWNPKPFAKNLKHLRGCVLWVILDADGNFHSKNHHHLSIPPNLGGQICCFTFFLFASKKNSRKSKIIFSSWFQPKSCTWDVWKKPVVNHGDFSYLSLNWKIPLQVERLVHLENDRFPSSKSSRVPLPGEACQTL